MISAIKEYESYEINEDCISMWFVRHGGGLHISEDFECFWMR